MLFKNYIWDFDGTLYDSYPHSEGIFQAYLAREKGIEAAMPLIDSLARQSWHHAFNYFGLTKDEAKRVFELEADMSVLPRVVPFPGAIELLRDVVRAGGRNYLYTHRDNLAIEYLRLEGILDLFDDFVTADMDFPSKPAPDAVLYLIEKHGLDPRKTVMIGDREIDAGAGMNAGAAGLLVTDNESLRAASQATITAVDLADIRRMLDIPEGER
ncbi:MAG: HAD-IA family hydrolase [Clostridia bacterium]|nr:HAD-IA family hydrolase [Clostridia bacterium]